MKQQMSVSLSLCFSVAVAPPFLFAILFSPFVLFLAESAEQQPLTQQLGQQPRPCMLLTPLICAVVHFASENQFQASFSTLVVPQWEYFAKWHVAYGVLTSRLVAAMLLGLDMNLQNVCTNK